MTSVVVAFTFPKKDATAAFAAEEKTFWALLSSLPRFLPLPIRQLTDWMLYYKFAIVLSRIPTL